MKLRAEKFQRKHVEILNDFLRRRQMPKAKLDFLPPTGICVYNYEQPVCIGFMIKMDNGVAETSDFISDIQLPKMLRQDAVQFMRKWFELEAKSCGIKALVAYTSHEKHVDRLSSLGYKTINKNLVHLGRFLWLSQA